jgi:hypothetical protein
MSKYINYKSNTSIWIIYKSVTSIFITHDKPVEVVCMYNDQKSFLQKVLSEDQNVKI